MRPKRYVDSVISDIISILLFKYKKIPPPQKTKTCESTESRVN